MAVRGGTQRARGLRRNTTDAEAKLWSRLRNRQLMGFKFVRQHPVGPFVADFACRDANLIVEVDGGQHADSMRDHVRTSALGEHGFEVLRFWNGDVLGNTDWVVAAIGERLSKAPSPGLRFAKSDLSPQGEVGPALSSADRAGAGAEAAEGAIQ